MRDRLGSDAPWIFEDERAPQASATGDSASSQRPPIHNHHQHTPKPKATGRWTPGLVLDCWIMVACFFLVGIGEGDRYIFLATIAQSYPAILDKSLRYHGGLCFSVHDYINVLTAAPELCQVAGAFLAVLSSARWGRRASLWSALTLYAVSRLLQLTAFYIEQFFAAGFLLATANGIILQVTVVDVIEIAPLLSRGSLIGCLFFGQYLGTLCGSLLAFGLSSLNQRWAWRCVPAYSFWISVLMMVLLKGLPETPANLLKKGRLAEGRAALQEIRGYLADIEPEYNMLLETTRLGYAFLPQLRALWHDCTCRLALFTSLICMLVLPALNVLAVYDAAKYILLHLLMSHSFARGGYGSSSSSSSSVPTAAEQRWMQPPPHEFPSDLARQAYANYVQTSLIKNNVLTLVLQQSAQLLGSVLAIAVADPWGRRSGTAAAFAVSSCWSLIVAITVHVGQVDKVSSLSTVWAAAAFVILTEVFSAAAFIMVYIYLLEIQPRKTRVLSCSFTIATRGLHLFLLQMVFFRLMCSLNGWAIFLTSCLVTLGLAGGALLLMIETSNCPTDDIPQLWCHHWLWKRLVAPHASALTGKG